MRNLGVRKLVVLGLAFLTMSMVLFGGVNRIYADGQDKDHDGLPDGVEKIYGTNPYAADTDGDGQNDKIDNQPIFLKNPIEETSQVNLPVKVKDVRVEDNFTAEHKDTPDHLQISLTNTSDQLLKGFEIYYTITDKKTGDQEAYYRKLDVQLPVGKTVTIYFDNQNKANHYPGNMNGLYGTSSNGLTFNISLHLSGFTPLNFKVEKAPGTAEVAD